MALALFVRTADGSQRALEVSTAETVGGLRARLAEMEAQPPRRVLLNWQGESLCEDRATLADCGVTSQATLDMLVRTTNLAPEVQRIMDEYGATARRRCASVVTALEGTPARAMQELMSANLEWQANQFANLRDTDISKVQPPQYLREKRGQQRPTREAVLAVFRSLNAGSQDGRLPQEGVVQFWGLLRDTVLTIGDATMFIIVCAMCEAVDKERAAQLTAEKAQALGDDFQRQWGKISSKISAGGEEALKNWCQTMGLDWEGFTAEELAEQWVQGIDMLEFDVILKPG